jgi:hypothetical protein
MRRPGNPGAAASDQVRFSAGWFRSAPDLTGVIEPPRRWP